MECVICKNGNTKSGTDTLTFDIDSHLIIIKDVPGDICKNCGHFYVATSAAIQVQKKAEDAIKAGATLRVINYHSATK